MKIRYMLGLLVTGFLAIAIASAQTRSGLTSSGCSAPFVAAGTIFEHGSPGNTITVTTAGTRYPWTTATIESLVGGMGADINDAAGDHLTVPRDSFYFVGLSSSFAGTGGAIVECDIFFNGVKSIHGFIRKMGVGGLADIGVVACSGVDPLPALTEISYRCTSDDDADQVVLYHMHLTAFEILGS